jgi:hypothetical protein
MIRRIKNVTTDKTSTTNLTSSTNLTNSSALSEDENQNNNLPIDELYKFIDLYFKKKNIMFSHLYNSFDKLLDEDIPNYLMATKCSFFEKMTKDEIIEYGFDFSNVAVRPPLILTMK